LRTTAPHSHEAVVVGRLLAALNYHQVVVMTVDGDQDGQEFVTVFTELSSANKIHVHLFLFIYFNYL
jgi:hypothetical protein